MLDFSEVDYVINNDFSLKKKKYIPTQYKHIPGQLAQHQRGSIERGGIIKIPDYTNKYTYLQLSDIVLIELFCILFFLVGIFAYKKLHLFSLTILIFSFTIGIVSLIIYFTHLNYYFM